MKNFQLLLTSTDYLNVDIIQWAKEDIVQYNENVKTCLMQKLSFLSKNIIRKIIKTYLPFWIDIRLWLIYSIIERIQLLDELTVPLNVTTSMVSYLDKIDTLKKLYNSVQHELTID